MEFVTDLLFTHTLSLIEQWEFFKFRDSFKSGYLKVDVTKMCTYCFVFHIIVVVSCYKFLLGRWKLHTHSSVYVLSNQSKLLICTTVLCLNSMYSILARDDSFFSGKEMHLGKKKKKTFKMYFVFFNGKAKSILRCYCLRAIWNMFWDRQEYKQLKVRLNWSSEHIAFQNVWNER